ncbi:polysaccharide biosynthesis/export family protein [Sphingomonas qomolangmaensis]|uniref:Polysaccharide export protein n=1 Tax=Sphingomonas qomolangmaensis TaxID=2918765 RepID=A0ABY5L606_9SPHN|nr:polysaccharide biosynthesis/export family protein [Sphingomonas qomolangmaensis]UUL82385.1 polysaccharide export protein [Sphingomonas qomolangmaensis]
MHLIYHVRRILMATLILGLSACSGSLPPPGSAAYTATEYRLAAGDRLRITVFGEENLSREYVVSSAGDLSFPLLGDIRASGTTVTELQAQLVTALAKGYINDPRVNAEVLTYRPFYILGEVKNPGEYKFSDRLTFTQAVALAGGFTYRADQRRVFIRRAAGGQEETYVLSSDRPVYIAPGDTIRVGERYF